MSLLRLLPAMMLLAGCGDDAGTSPGNNPKPLASTAILTRNVAEEAAPITPAAAPVSRETATSARAGAQPPAPSRPSPASYRAIGTEPFWAVTVDGSTALLERPDHPRQRYTIVRNDDGSAIRYIGEGFTMTLTAGPCSDGMSDSIWSDRVAVAFGGGTLKGCGGEREPDEFRP